MKYIDAEKLIHDLVERINAYSKGYATGDNYRKDAIEILLEDVKHQLSLHQEQQKVDLEKVLSGFTGYYAHENSGEYPSAIDIARHFYELGLKTKKEKN